MFTHLQKTGGQSRNFPLLLRQISIILSVLIYLPFSLSANERPSLSFSEKTFLELKDALLSQMTDLSQTAANLNKNESEASEESSEDEFNHSSSLSLMTSAIGDFAFKDCDLDGIQDPEEEGLEGVSVTLSGTDINGLTVNRMTLTDSLGFYIFDTLAAGTYTLFFDFPADIADLEYGPQAQGTDPELDSDIDETTGTTAPITLVAGERNLTIDAAFLDFGRPTAVDLVDPLILSCTDTFPELQFIDNCADEISIITTSEIVLAQDSCETRTKRAWLISDNCGNINSICQTVIQGDNTPPVATPTPDTLVLCPSDAINVPAPTFSDDCDMNLTITMNEGNIPVDDCEYQIHRFYQATDFCGNSTEVLQIITVKDTAEVTVISEPSPTSFSCSLGAVELPEITNSCGESIPLTADTSYIPGDCENRFIANINYTSTNECYTYNFTHVVNIIDDTAPVLVGANPADINIECGAEEPALILEFTDNCNGDITQTSTSTTTDLVCGSTILQSITARDICGNEVTITRTINVVDTVEPTLSGVPANELADCDGTANIPSPANVTASDICDGNVPVSFSEVQQNMACAGAYMIIRTWTATDACGNSTSQSQTITVGDDGPPVIEGVPTNQTVQCELPELPLVTANDNCGTVDLQFIQSIPVDTCSNYEVTRTWTATDDCGNVSSESYTITVEITTPTAEDFPAVLTYQCDETISVEETPTIIQGCYSAEITDFTETNIPGACPQEYSLAREWTVTDDCGNDFIISQTVNVVDTVAPVLTILEPMLQGLEDGDSIYIECDAMISLNENGATASDNCDDDLEVMFMEMPGENADCAVDGYIAHMICGWKAIDDCGNQGQILINFFIVDNTEPMLFGVPNDVNASCNYDLTPPNVGVMDNCDFDIAVEMTETETGEPCNRVIIRKWTATDHCGNMIMHSQTINLTDTEDPVLVGVPDDMVISCNQIPEVPNVTATDDCSDDLEVIFTQNINGLSCEEQQINRVWTVTDNCGNTTTAQQTITILDDAEPVLIGVPDNISILCSSTIPTPPTVTATDDCDTDLEVNFSEEIIGNTCDAYQIIRIWTVTDNCGNTTSSQQVISIADDMAPILIGVPDDITSQCNDFPAPANVSATDDCDSDLEVTFTENIIGNTCESYQIIRIWTVTDDCGNTTSSQQVISIADDIAPILTGVPDDITIQCNDLPTAANVSATDDCDSDLEVIFTENTLGNNCSNYQIIRTWTVTDDCGNITTGQQIITTSDDEAPNLIGVPSDITVECDAIPTVPIVTASDNCDEEVNVLFTENETGGSCQDRRIIRTWTAMDDCGNTVSLSQRITVDDNIAPVLSGVPNNETIECSNLIPTAPDVTATDNCDESVIVILNETITGNTCDEQQIIRTWTATDDCGNVASATQTIILTDDTAPAFVDAPADITVECDAVPQPLILSATDDCDNNLTVDFSANEIEGDCKDNYTIIRTWSVSDNCGNTTIHQQTITVEDTQGPNIVLINPLLVGLANGDTLSYQCNPDVFGLNDATVSDNCDAEPILSFVELLIDDDPCHTVLACTWTAEDICGNVSVFVIYIKVEDTTPPVFDNTPINTTADCNNMPAIDDITATDNCNGDVTIEISENSTGGTCENLQITRIYTATDQCGNSSSVSQIITVTDNESPVLVDIPDDVTLECHEDISPANVSATDDCDSNVEVQMTEETITGSCENEYTLIRTWTATDGCGNAVSATQTVTVQDTNPPLFVGVPEDIDIECNELPNPPIIGDEIKAADLCDDDVLIIFEEEYIGDDCANFQLIRRWTATDNCGNMSIATQVISLSDNTPPVLTNIPEDTYYQCNAPVISDLPSATDACDDDVEITVEEGQVDLDCGFIIVRIFTATDNCGNTSSASQTISIIDTTPPTISGVPSDLSLECDEEIPAPIDVDVIDNCGATTVTVEETTEQSTSCENNYTITRVYTATDDCGNSSTATQIITIVDTTAPTLTFNTPQLIDFVSGDTLFLECNELFNVEDAAIITDNCNDNPNVVFSEETIVGTDCQADGYLINLVCTWEVSDDCGNNFTYILNIVISDNTPPVIFCPQDITVNLGIGEIIPSSDDINIVDNCTDNIDLLVNETNIPDSDDCGYTLVRVYTAMDECGNTITCEQNITVEEFCECPEIIVTDTDNYPTSCAGEDGIYDVTLEDAAAYDYVLVPNYGTSNEIGNTRTNLPVGDYLLVISQPDFDTCEVKLYFTIVDGCTDCNTEVFASSDVNIELTDCNDLGRVCLTIEEESVTDYSISLNNEPYTGSLVGCTFDTTFNYATAAIPGWGMEGPYTVTNWTINDIDFSAEFNDLTELMNIINDWDPSGNWTLSMGSITGGNTANSYGNMLISQNNTGASASLMKNTGTSAVGLAVVAPLGEHEFIFTHNQTGCADTANVSVYCSPIITPSNAELIVARNSTETFCLDISELQGNIVSLESICTTETEAQYASLTSFDATYCLNVSGLDVGQQNFCYQVCDDFGFCDTTYLNVIVTEQIFMSNELPVAIPDDYTVEEGEPIVIDVCLNDEINGVLESHSIRSLPQTGTAILRGNEIEYTPEADLCQDITFVYEICNDLGCDEAEVTIHYFCDDVIIFNGFSPNNDNVNDAFTILGLERYPNHNLQVFSRWGTKVFSSQNYQNDWKGTNAGKDLPDGTYFYLFDNGEGERLSGHVTIKR